MLKKLAMGTALATLIAVPAFAAQPYAHVRDHSHWTQAASRGQHAYAYMPGATGFMGRSDQVYFNGNYAGQDPDPNVRLQLDKRNPNSY